MIGNAEVSKTSKAGSKPARGANNWIKTGTGYSDTTQQVPFEKIIEEECKHYIWSCILYYKYDDPVLSDTLFEHTENMIEKYYDIAPAWFKKSFEKGTLKTNAHSFIGSDEQEKEALEWKEKSKIRRTK